MKTVEQLAVRTAEVVDARDVTFPMRGVGVFALKHAELDLHKLGEALGLEATGHDASGSTVWDIRPVTGDASGPVARSHTDKEFTWHTDASFERIPPRYFMLHVVHGDKQGGGTQGFMDVDDIVAGMSEASRRTLSQTRLQWRVPAEFHKGSESEALQVFFKDAEGKTSMRFRAECISREGLAASVQSALANLESAIESAPVTEHTPQAGQLLFVDNWHALHRRSAISDPRRHLRRIRFQ